MVSREKVLEKRLDDIRTFVNALKIALVIQLPISFVTALAIGFKIEILTSLIVYLVFILGILIRQIKIREKLYIEWGKDPMNGEQDIIDAIILAIASIIVYVVASIL